MGEDKQPTPENGTFIEAFEWHVPADGKHWKRLLGQLEPLKALGVQRLQIPPACKASAPEGNGYDIYDLWDLGEFDQKGSTGTKWGPKEDLLEMSKKAKELGVGLYLDAVINHKAGADRKEKVRVVEVDSDDRNKDVSDPYEIDAWVGFDFPGRGDKYSAFKWNWHHFSGTDFNAENNKTAIYRFVGDEKHWSNSVDDEQGNADYVMFADIDYANDDVRKDVLDWGVWVIKEIGLAGFRMDAIQHVSQNFVRPWTEHVRKECGDVFIVGEFWVPDAEKQAEWIKGMGQEFSLFDSPLLYNFKKLASSERGDLRTVFDGTLVSIDPTNACTVVTNHDTQTGQTINVPIDDLFKPLAYALILLRADGYPTLFYGDLYGTLGDNPEPPSCSGKLPDLTLARNLYAYGQQDDYFDAPNCVGWVRRGTWDRPAGLAVVMSNAEAGTKHMLVGKEHAGEVWSDLLEWETANHGEVTIDEEGWADFMCAECSLSVWVKKDAQGRERFPVKFDADIYKKS